MERGINIAVLVVWLFDIVPVLRLFDDGRSKNGSSRYARRTGGFRRQPDISGKVMGVNSQVWRLTGCLPTWNGELDTSTITEISSRYEYVGKSSYRRNRDYHKTDTKAQFPEESSLAPPPPRNQGVETKPAAAERQPHQQHPSHSSPRTVK